MAKGMERRELLKKGLALSAGVAAFSSLEDKILLAAAGKQQPPAAAVADTGDMPMGKLGPLSISRLITGGNLVSGYAHSRDLIYVSPLLKSYFTEAKIFETWHLSEECGINTAILRLDNQVVGLLDRYWNNEGGKLQWIAQVKPDEKNIRASFQWAADSGASAAFVHGSAGDSFVQNNRVDLLGECLAAIRENLPVAGIACHDINVVMACEKAGLNPDFYMKTIHRGDYWSANAPQKHDNIFSERTEEAIAFMKTVKKPWIGFKVLAAGAIHPRNGFQHAFENGADFINVGMFDFQVREDVLIAKNAVAACAKRERPWFA